MGKGHTAEEPVGWGDCYGTTFGKQTSPMSFSPHVCVSPGSCSQGLFPTPTATAVLAQSIPPSASPLDTPFPKVT